MVLLVLSPISLLCHPLFPLLKCYLWSSPTKPVHEILGMRWWFSFMSTLFTCWMFFFFFLLFHLFPSQAPASCTFEWCMEHLMEQLYLAPTLNFGMYGCPSMMTVKICTMFPMGKGWLLSRHSRSGLISRNMAYAFGGLDRETITGKMGREAVRE